MYFCRCLRLGKDCQPSESVRRRERDAQRVESDTRIAQLEDKMETLVATIQNLVSSSGPPVGISRFVNEEEIASSTSRSKSRENGTKSSTSTETLMPPRTDPFFPSRHDFLPSSDALPYQAEESLEFFRSRMLPCFPFLTLDPEITAWHLHRERPFLFQAILTITTFSTQRRLARTEELKRTLSTSALLNAQSNIDLLLGLLTYLAWSTDAFLGKADLVSRLMMLAISLVYDLRLFKPSPLDVQVMMAITQGHADVNGQYPSEETAQSFMEKQRAVLACFILSSKYP